jgi:hypothetical protein
MGSLHALAGGDHVVAMPVASLWNIADPTVPDQAKPGPIAWRHSAVSTVNEGEMSRLNADWLAWNGRRVAGDRSLRGILSKVRAGYRQAGQPSASLTEISRNDRVWSCDATSGERIARATIVDRGSLDHDAG